MKSVAISEIRAAAYRLPTPESESDGTLDWNQTVVTVVQLSAGNREGLGYGYGSPAAVNVVRDTLAPAVQGINAMDTEACWNAMRRAVRNVGQSGIAAGAISAVDIALWDLKCKLLDASLLDLLGASRRRVPAYGSGGFTNHGPERIMEDIVNWRTIGLHRFKIKIGRDAEADRLRITAALSVLKSGEELFVDANGAYHARQATTFARELPKEITWLEEPVSSEDVEGLAFVRRHSPAHLAVAAGEYIYGLEDARRLLGGPAVDVVQLDATRCLGITGFLKCAILCEAAHIPISAHTAPALHGILCCHTSGCLHVEYFADHVRIESEVFTGGARLQEGELQPPDEAGLGLHFLDDRAHPYRLNA